MDYIYLDNFRGFQQQIVELSQVNFLVGENSTGKSSFLAALKIINDCMRGIPDFNNQAISLGSFDDIVSKASKDKNYFRLGLISLKKTKLKENQKEKNEVFTIVFEFKQTDRVPQLSKAIICVKNRLYFLKYTDTKILIAEKKLRSFNKPEDFLKHFNEEILVDLNEDDFEYESLVHIGFRSWPFSRLLNYALLHNRKRFVSFSHLMPNVAKRILNWGAPIREKPQRIYEAFKFEYTPEGGHIPYFLSQLLADENSENNGNTIRAINSFGKASGLFDKLEIERLGNSNEAPFRINIKLNNNSYKISSIGYGVSQILPLVVDTVGMPQDSLFAIQQPEVHLHPKAQAAFGEVLCSLAIGDNKGFFIETHSDFIIDRFRISLSQSKTSNDDFGQVLFFTKNKDGNKIDIIKINKNGSYGKNQPKEFKEFFINEEISLLKI